MPETHRLSCPAPGGGVPRLIIDLRTVALALGPEHWESLQEHLDACLRPASSRDAIDSRSARLAAFAHLVRSARSRPQDPLSRSERRVVRFRPAYLGLLRRKP